MTYRPEIDGLRAIAVLSVIFFHAGFDIFSGGYAGVDVFFVISGYLITTILIKDIENKKFSIIKFYERRARRIMPALFLVMAISIPFAWLWLIPSDMNSYLKSIIAVSLFASNILFWRESGYFEADTEEKPLLHTWSLAVEEQYYLLFPILLALIWRLGKRPTYTIIIIITLVSFLLSEWGWRNQPDANFYLSPTRAWEMFAGSIAAFFIHSNGLQKNNFLSSLGLFGILISVVLYDENIPFPSYYTLLPVISTAMIIIFGRYDTIVAKVLSIKLLVGVGLISYSAYLWHQPIFAYFKVTRNDHPSTNMMFILIAISLVLAIFSWRYIERPFRNPKMVSQRAIFIFSLSGMAFFIVFSLAALNYDNFHKIRYPDKPLLTELYPIEDQKWAKFVRTTENNNCELLGLNTLDEEVCITNSEEPKLLIVGDSKAMALASAVFASYVDHPTLLIAAHGCTLYPNLTYTPNLKNNWGNNCTEIGNKIGSIPNKFSSIEEVLVVIHAVEASSKLSKFQSGNNVVSYETAAKTGFSSLLNNLVDSTANVTFITDTPDLKKIAETCIYNKKTTFNDCNHTKENVKDIRLIYYNIIDEIANIIPITVFDSVDYMCPTAQCISILNNKILYFDKTHLTPFGASYLLEKLNL